MMNINKILFMLLLPAAMAPVAFSQNAARISECFDSDWKFCLQDVKEAEKPDFDDSEWEDVQLPHDWSISLEPDSTLGGSNGFLPGGVGWYRKTFEAPDGYRGRRVSIHFDGVYHRSDVYVNGRHLGFHPYGYTGFEYDLTPYLKYGRTNVIAVRVDHSNAPSSRWYSGSGIYRHVRLNVLNPVHVATWGTYVTTPETDGETAKVKVETRLENSGKGGRTVTLESAVLDDRGAVVATASTPVTLGGGSQTMVGAALEIASPRRWSVEQPTLYRLVTTVRENAAVLDRYETPFGVRDIRFDPDRGFFLNGKSVKLKGVCLHQDAGSLGAALPLRSMERRLQILKEFGCNAIRCSHNPPAPEFLDLCDSLGFLVIDEAFDKWKGGYYAAYFDEWWQKDLSAMLLRDRNHPSVILWSIGNEVGEQNDTTGVGTERLRMLRDHVRRIDPTRMVTAAIMSGDLSRRAYNHNGFNDALDAVGYNYQDQFFTDDHRQFPSRIIYGSEVLPYYRAGKELFREYGERNPWYDTADNNFVAGYFIWSGVDYLGESSGWPSMGWPTAPFDVCMFEKPYAAFLRAVWNPDKPTVSIAVVDQSLDIDPGKDLWTWPMIASHWTFPQYRGRILHVQTITNCEEVELWVNGVTLGRRRLADYANNTIQWRAPWRPGSIVAKGYNGGVETAVCELKTAGKPARIELTADKTSPVADGQDLTHVTVRLLDENGTAVPNSDLPVTFEVAGEGRLIGVDNGDLRNHEPRKGNRRTTYFGRALAIIQSTRTGGVITLRATAPGIPESLLTVSTQE